MRLAGMGPRRLAHGAKGPACGLALIGVAALAAVLWPPDASSAVSDKAYTATVSVSPAVPEDDAPADAAAEVWAGAAPRVSVTITNTSATPQTLGSVNIDVPAGITPVAGTTAITSTQSPFAGTVTLSGSQLRLRNLGLAVGRSVTASVDAQVTCQPTAPAYALASAVKQSNDFNGTGNDFTLSGGAPALDAVGACSLAFTSQPASAQRGTDITRDVYLPFSASTPGGPVTVQVRDGSGSAPVSWWSQPVTLGVDPAANPGAATLQGLTSATPVAGTATFRDATTTPPTGPRIGVSASGYRLRAASGTLAPRSSSAFDVVDVGRRCTGGQSCPGASSSTRTTASVDALATNDGDILRLSLGALDTPAPVCAGYTPSTDTLDFDLTTSAGAPSGGQRTVVLTLLASYVTKPANKYTACFQSTLPFTTASGAPAVAAGGYYTGLLPTCGRTPVAPCQFAPDKNRAGDVIVTFIAPPGDPRARF